MKYKKSLGQHYLSSVSTAKKIVSLLEIEKEDTIIEIGAGRGALTRHIVENKLKKLIIIELDRENAKYLEKEYPQAEIICKDARKVNYRSLLNHSVKVISNLPYNVGTGIFKELVKSGALKKMVLMFQKEVADRITAKTNTKNYSRLSLLAKISYTAKKAFDVKPGSFTPPPKIMSTVIKLDSTKSCPLIPNYELFSKLTRMAFNNRRKMLRVSLKELIPPAKLKKILNELNIKDTQRPQTLDLEDFINIIQHIFLPHI